MALSTVEDYVNEARVLLQDQVSPYRYADLELVSALNFALLETRRLRPDLFLGDGTTTTLEEIDQFTVVNDDAVDIEQGFRLAILFAVCAFAMMRDQEDVTDQRVGGFMKLFMDRMITLRS